VHSNGTVRGDVPFGVGPLSYLLKTRFLIGEVVYRGEVYPGEQEPILIWPSPDTSVNWPRMRSVASNAGRRVNRKLAWCVLEFSVVRFEQRQFRQELRSVGTGPLCPKRDRYLRQPDWRSE
jgi:hypothetical protein